MCLFLDLVTTPTPLVLGSPPFPRTLLARYIAQVLKEDNFIHKVYHDDIGSLVQQADKLVKKEKSEHENDIDTNDIFTSVTVALPASSLLTSSIITSIITCFYCKPDLLTLGIGP